MLRPGRAAVVWIAAGVALAALGAWRFHAATGNRTPKVRIRSLEQTVRRNPGDAAARRELSELYLATGDRFAAIEQLEAARSAGTPGEGLLVRLAELYRERGLAEDAVEVLQQAVEQPRASDAVRGQLAQAQMTLGDFAGAADALEPLTARFRDLPPETASRLVRQLLLAGRWEAAAPLLPTQTRDPEWLALRGLHSMLTGKKDAAVRDLERVVALTPNDPWNRYLLALACTRSGDRARAQAAFGEASGLPEAPPRAHIGLARLLAESGRWELAATALSRTGTEAAADPEYWRVRTLIAQRAGRPGEAYLARGRAAAADGDPLRAEDLYRQGLALAKPGDHAGRDLRTALVLSAEARQDTPAALRFAGEGARLWPGEPLFHRRRAELLLEGNRYEECAAEVRLLANTAPPEDAAAVADLEARLALESGQQAALEEAARRGIALDARDANPYLLLAEWHIAHGDPERALSICLDAVRAAPENAEAHARLGSQLVELKDYEGAARELRRAISLDPAVLDGAPDVQLAQIYRRQGRSAEAEPHERRFRRLRAQKNAWQDLLRVLRRKSTAQEYRDLGRAALERRAHEVARWSFTYGLRLSPQDAEMWRGLAAVQKRLGLFEAALQSMRRAHTLGRPLAPRGAGFSLPLAQSRGAGFSLPLPARFRAAPI